MHTLSVRAALTFAWTTFKKRPWMFIGAYLLALVVSSVLTGLLDTEGMEPLSPVAILMSLASLAIGLLVEIGIVTFAIRAHDNVASVTIHDLWNPKPFLRYLGAQILVGAAVIIGLILLIVPGVIAALALFMTSYLVVDRGLGPITAMKESYAITKGHWGKLFVFVLAVVGLNILGMLALLVGLLVTVPLTMLMMVHAYRTLEKHKGEAHIQAAEESIAVS